jgi:hypothetical protein
VEDAQHVAMVAFASSRINDGRSLAEAYGDLVSIGVAARPAAVAVCVAAGNSREVAERRVVEFDDVWGALTDPATAGTLLEQHGFFDVEAVLDEEQQAIAAHLRRAVAAAGWFPPVAAQAVFRQVRTGRLREALRSLEDLGRERWPHHEEYWEHLTRAADGLR